MENPTVSPTIEQAVRDRYARAARGRETSLCCPTAYDPRHLEAIPREILDHDYGCGDPSRFARPGDTVVDLGSGGGKIAYILSQVVGPEGRVIGVDFTDEMLALARRHRDAVGARVGWRNVEFRRGRIQDLALDLDRLDAWLASHPVRAAADLEALRDEEARLRRDEPMIPDGSAHLVVSNCVLNLVRGEDRAALFREMHRVLRRGGRVAISDIVSDEAVPPHLQADPDLWSGCVSGAFQEEAFLRAFEAAGFHGVAIAAWSEEPFAVVDGIEFRSVTVTAHKGKEGPCHERLQAALYRGPYRQVLDDDGHVFPRGVRVAVCEKTFELLRSGPYAADFVFLEPREAVPAGSAAPFDCARTAPRHPRETKGTGYAVTRPPGTCEPGCCGAP
jgi:ubiquinone/menaquinone biosynthesis C-methylase UbiE